MIGMDPYNIYVTMKSRKLHKSLVFAERNGFHDIKMLQNQTSTTLQHNLKRQHRKPPKPMETHHLHSINSSFWSIHTHFAPYVF